MTTTKQYFKVKNGLEFPKQETLSVTDNGGPSVQPSLLLDFSNTKKLDSRVSFTRATTGTYFDGKTVAHGEENLLFYSEQPEYGRLNGGYWSPSNTINVENSGVDPIGGNTAILCTEDTAAASIHIPFYTSLQWASNSTYTLSVYAKYGSRKFIYLSLCTTVNQYASVEFDIYNGIFSRSSVVGTNYSVLDYSITPADKNGWFRLSATIQTGVSGSTCRFFAGMSDGVSPFDVYGRVYYTGESKYVYLWGVQVEERSYLTAYNKTTLVPISNQQPCLTTADINKPRIEVDPLTKEVKGLLIEEARTNLLYCSSDFSNSNWIKVNSNIVSNVTIAPDGTNSADKFIDDGVSVNVHQVAQGYNATNGSTYTFSVFVKSAELTSVTLAGNATFNNFSATYDLVSGTVSSSANTASGSIVKIQSAGNGWWRVSAAFTATGYGYCYIVLPGTNTSQTGLYVWGAQLEAGPFATSYIPTVMTYSGRPSLATYTAKDGLLKIAKTDELRNDVNMLGGLTPLIENGSSNIFTLNSGQIWLTYSAVSPASLSDMQYSYNSDIAPDGTYTALRINRFAQASISRLDYGTSLSAVAAGAYTYSVWLKGTGSIAIAINSSVGGPDYQEKTITLTPYWKRYSVSATFTSGTTGGTIRAHVVISRSANNTADVYVWGPQIELGNTPTSYIYPKLWFKGRQSTGTYYDTTGTLKTAPRNVPRYTTTPNNYLVTAVDPYLLLEPASTNLLPYSSAFNSWSNGGQTGATYVANTAVAPDGTNTAYKLKFSSTVGVVQFEYNTGAVSSVTQRTFSIYVKMAECRFVTLAFHDGSSGEIAAKFDIKDGVIFTAPTAAGNWTYPIASIQQCQNGWFRISLSANSGATTASWYSKIYFNTVSSGFTGTGDNASGIYAWGAQLEPGASTTSFIYTNGTSVTRAADDWSYDSATYQPRIGDYVSYSTTSRSGELGIISGSDFSKLVNQLEGTMYAEVSLIGKNPLSPGYTQGIFALVGYDSYYSSITLNAVKGGTTYQAVTTYSRAVAYVDILGQNITPGQYSKQAFSYKYNNVSYVSGGIVNGTDVSVSLPSNLIKMHIGSDYFVDRYLNGYIRKIALYPVALQSTELQSLTTS